MKRITLYITLFLMMSMLYGCSKSVIDVEELSKNTECEIAVRKNSEEEYVAITDEVIHNNLRYLLLDILSGDKITISKNGSIPFTNDWQIKISNLDGEDYVIGFSIYYVSEYVDGGRRAIILEKGNDIEYYYLVNDLYNFLPLAITNNRTLTGKVGQMEAFEVYSDYFGTMKLQYDSLPQNITEGSIVEITLGEMTETSKGFYAQSIVEK